MHKVCIITDSNSGITQNEGNELGIFVIPMPFSIDGTDYYEDINLTQDDFYEKLTGDFNVSTSQPSPETVMEYWRKGLENNDSVVYIPMSSGLSGSYQTAWMLSHEDEFEGKVFVVNNQRISVTMRQSVLDAIVLANKGMCGAEIARLLEEDKFNSSIYIMLDTLEYLKNGGRLTPAVALLGQLLKIKPVLTIQGDKLDAFSQVRTASKGKAVMIAAIKNDIVERFGCDEDGSGMRVMVVHTQNEDVAREFLEEIKETFPKAEYYIDCLSLSVSCHIGPGALAIACAKISFK